MGVGRLATIARRLIAAGRPADEPAAVVERGTLPGQRTVLATLATIADRAAEEGIKPPAVTVVGAVAAARERLAWLEDRPLHGRTVAVTAPGRRPASSRPGCARWAPRSSRRLRSASSPSPSTRPIWMPTTSSA